MVIRWKGFVITCSQCGHKNMPHRSPREGIRLTLIGQVGNCKGCGKVLKTNRLLQSTRPLVLKVRAELAAAGVKTVC